MVSVEFDKEVNALYLRLKKGKVKKSDPVADNIVCLCSDFYSFPMLSANPLMSTSAAS